MKVLNSAVVTLNNLTGRMFHKFIFKKISRKINYNKIKYRLNSSSSAQYMVKTKLCGSFKLVYASKYSDNGKEHKERLLCNYRYSV